MSDEFSSPNFDPKRWINSQLQANKTKPLAAAGTGTGSGKSSAQVAIDSEKDPEVKRLLIKEDALSGVYSKTLNQSTEIGEAMDATCNELFTALPKYDQKTLALTRDDSECAVLIHCDLPHCLALSTEF